MCTVLLPPGVNSIAVNISYRKVVQFKLPSSWTWYRLDLYKYKRFGWPCCLHLHVIPYDGSSNPLRNTGTVLLPPGINPTAVNKYIIVSKKLNAVTQRSNGAFFHAAVSLLLESKITRGADKSLAPPGRKEATATKLGIYSTNSPRSSIHFLNRCSNFCKPLKTNSECRPSNQVSASAMTSASLRGELPLVQIFMNDGTNPLTSDVQLLSYWSSLNPAVFQD